MKNKEIEELLNELKEDVKYYKNDYDYKNSVAFFNIGKIELLLSYIEQLEKDKQVLIRNNNIGNERLKELQNINKQLETDYKEANDSVTWWTNRYNAIVKQNDDNHKKVVKLENNIDKAIEFIKEKRKVFEWYDTDLFYLESLLKGDNNGN